MGRLAAVMIAFLVLAGAAAAKEATGVQVEDDQFSASATFLGPSEDTNPLSTDSKAWRLRSWVDKKTLKATHQLYVDVVYKGEWRMYETAADDSATAHEVLTIDRSVISCRYGCTMSETVGVDLTNEFLRAHRSGFAVKVSAHSGDSVILAVSSNQVELQLAAVDAYIGQRTAAVPPTPQAKTAAPRAASPPPPSPPPAPKKRPCLSVPTDPSQNRC
jgi:hypothetical protein